MGYDVAINKAWSDYAGLNPDKNISVRFLADEYIVGLEAKRVFSLACNVAAGDFSAILILHYLIQRLKGLPGLTSEWLTFRELAEIEGYYPAFKKRAIEPIIRKYGKDPAGILQALERLPAKKVTGADVAIVLEAFQGVPVLVKLWQSDEEFGPDANMLFDKSITRIFCIEDIVVLAGLVAANL